MLPWPDSVEQLPVIIGEYYTSDLAEPALGRYLDFLYQLDNSRVLDRWGGIRPLNNEQDGVLDHVLSKWTESLVLDAPCFMSLRAPENGKHQPQIRLNGYLSAQVITFHPATVFDYAVPCLQLALGTKEEDIIFPDDSPLVGRSVSSIEGGVIEIVRSRNKLGGTSIKSALLVSGS